MNRKDSIEQDASGSFRGSTWALSLAGAVAVAAIGYAILREERNPPVAPSNALTRGSLSGIEELERQVAAAPQDAQLWRQLGQAYFDDGRFEDAVRANQRAAAQNPSRAELWSALGEAQVMASKTDPMPAAAAANFAHAISLDSKDPRARYFVAVRKDLAGDHRGAIEDWLALLADTPKGAAWEADLQRTIEQVGKINRIDVASKLAAVKQPESQMPATLRGIPGPSAQDLTAAFAIPPGEQRRMAEGMVSRLEARLGTEPGDLDGWIMLIRSRMTLDQTDKAAAALRDAIAANPANADMLRRQAAILGVR